LQPGPLHVVERPTLAIERSLTCVGEQLEADATAVDDADLEVHVVLQDQVVLPADVVIAEHQRHLGRRGARLAVARGLPQTAVAAFAFDWRLLKNPVVVIVVSARGVPGATTKWRSLPVTRGVAVGVGVDRPQPKSIC